MDSETTKERLNALTFGVSAYEKMPHHRSYALDEQAKAALAALARAMFQRRAAEGRADMDGKPPSSHQEFFGIIERLNEAGCNLLQRKPNDAPPIPKPWTNPIDGSALAPPKTPDERAVLAKTDPELLQWFDRMAKSPYKAVAEMREAEAQRQSLMSVVYGQTEHQLNPYRGSNETAKGEFMKRDPLLAKFYEEEARDVELPIFKNKNLTVIGKLAKDPSTASLVQLAERIHDQWQAADKATALEQRAAAEEALKKLAEAAA